MKYLITLLLISTQLTANEIPIGTVLTITKNGVLICSPSEGGTFCKVVDQMICAFVNLPEKKTPEVPANHIIQ